MIDLKHRLLFFLLFASSYGYSQTSSGAIDGKIVDQQGAAVQKAHISVVDLAHNTTRHFDSDANGEFYATGLEAGDYQLQVDAPDFAEAKVQVTVRVSETRKVNVQLLIAGATAMLEVRENVEDESGNVIASPVTEQQIEETPLANRSFANMAYIAPMTAPVEPSDPTKARITAVSFAGSSGLNVDLSVDGGDNNDDYIGGFLQNYSPESVHEFNVRTAQFEPDTSRTNGGSVILSTKSGTNDWHGSVSGFFRADALNARNRLDNPEPNPKQPFSKQDYVATLGGPLKRDRLWAFLSDEYNREDASVAYSAGNLAEFQALSQLASSGQIPGVSNIFVPTSVVSPFRDSLLDSRLDWHQSERSHWFLRFSGDYNTTLNDLVQQAALPSTGFTTHSNYNTLLLSNEFVFNQQWSSTLVLDGSLFDHRKLRNSNIGLALAFPFSTTALTTSGFETFGDNQFQTAITAFPIQRNQQKYQIRYDLNHSGNFHDLKFGMNLVHEPVLSGRFSDSAETLAALPQDPSFYAANPGQFAADFAVVATSNPAGNGRFVQSIRRLGVYAQDGWKLTPRLTFNFGLRYDTTFGLFIAHGVDQNQNAAVLALRAAGVTFASGVPQDYRKAFSPRVGFAFAPGNGRTILRAGVGLYYNDLAQNGWAQAFQAVNGGPNPPVVVIDPHYHSPYDLQASAAVEREVARSWRFTAQYEHHQGVHQYRRYEYVSGISLPAAAPSTSVFRTDNRSSYDGVSFVAQHHSSILDLTVHYTLANATTWGATVGELFDYVNGVTDPLNPFGPGDHGPSGEDIRHRFVINVLVKLPFGFQVSTLAQFESARPYTMFTPVDINGDGNVNDRAVVNGVQTTLDQFRGTPFQQVDLRVSRDFKIGDRVKLRPFAEFFNLFNRTNPGNNFIPDITGLPMLVNDPSNATAFCLDAACASTRPISNINELRVPAGALGDFFGPGTTVGGPFAAQLGFKISF